MYGIHSYGVNSSDLNSIMHQINSSIGHFTNSYTLPRNPIFNYEDALSSLPILNYDDISRYSQLFPLDLSNSIIEDIQVVQNELINNYNENESDTCSDESYGSSNSRNNDTDED
jgi:hypothetical protein